MCSLLGAITPLEATPSLVLSLYLPLDYICVCRLVPLHHSRATAPSLFVVNAEHLLPEYGHTLKAFTRPKLRLWCWSAAPASFLTKVVGAVLSVSC